MSTTSTVSPIDTPTRQEPVPAGETTAPRTSSSAAASSVVTALPPVTVGRDAWVAVSVATLWRTPTSARAVDRPALANPAGIRQWLSRMTLTDRRALNGRADTQALLGDRVIVVARSGSWVKVVVPDQPTPLDARGYPGWVPTAQLTALRPVASGLVATVVARTTYLRTDNASATPVTEISFGARLPRVGLAGVWVRVATPTGRVLRLAASAVAVRAPTTPALPRTGGDVVRGSAVSTSALRPGDLLFYATSGYVHHVSIYAGSDRMVQSPRTGSTVQSIAMSTPSYAGELAGARRFIG